MTQSRVHQSLFSEDLVGKKPQTTLCSVTTLVFIYNQIKMRFCFKYLFIAFISAIFPFVGLFPCVYASWVSYPFIPSVSNLLVVSFCEVCPDAFQAREEALAEAGLLVGGGSLVPLAGNRDLGKGHAHGGCGSLLTTSAAVPVSEDLWGRSFLWITCASSMSWPFATQRAPFYHCGHLYLDKDLCPCSYGGWRLQWSEMHPWLIEKALLAGNLSLVLLTSSGSFDFRAYFVALSIIR